MLCEMKSSAEFPFLDVAFSTFLVSPHLLLCLKVQL